MGKMKFKLFAFLIIFISSLVYSKEKDIAVDKLGGKLEDRWGEPVYIDQINRKPIDKYGFPIKNEEIYNSGGFGKYGTEKPIYDDDGFKANRWDKK